MLAGGPSGVDLDDMLPNSLIHPKQKTFSSKFIDYEELNSDRLRQTYPALCIIKIATTMKYLRTENESVGHRLRQRVNRFRLRSPHRFGETSIQPYSNSQPNLDITTK